VPSTPDEFLEELFKEMEEQHQDSHVKIVIAMTTVMQRIKITAGH
jgi:hypothetical protein